VSSATSEHPKGEPRFDRLFNFLDQRAQKHVVDSCRAPELHPELKVFRSDCWILDFQKYVNGKGRAFPSVGWSHQYFADELSAWGRTSKKAKDLLERGVGFDDNGRLAYICFHYRIQVDRMSGGHAAEPDMHAWDKYVADLNTRAPRTAKAHHASELWAKASTELRIISSTIQVTALSNVVALVAVMIFTRHWRLALFTFMAVVSTLSLLLGFCVVVCGWDFGIVEAVAMIIFAGFSVDYALHVAQAYHHCHGSSKYERTAKALGEIGPSVIAGACTTVGSSVFLLCCTITLFTKFGVVLAVNMTIAVLYALVWLPCALMLFGPVQNACCGVAGNWESLDDDGHAETSNGYVAHE